jgi:hypothetical protein
MLSPLVNALILVMLIFAFNRGEFPINRGMLLGFALSISVMEFALSYSVGQWSLLIAAAGAGTGIFWLMDLPPKQTIAITAIWTVWIYVGTWF